MLDRLLKTSCRESLVKTEVGSVGSRKREAVKMTYFCVPLLPNTLLRIAEFFHLQ